MSNLSPKASQVLNALQKKFPGAKYEVEGNQVVVRFNYPGPNRGQEITRFPVSHLETHHFTIN